MNVNGIKSHSCTPMGTELPIVLECAIEEALAMDTSKIEVWTDQGSLVMTLVGYVKRSATIDVATGYVTLDCVLDANGAVAGLNALGEKMTEQQAILSALLGGE